MVLNWIEHNEDDYEDEKKYGRDRKRIINNKNIKFFHKAEIFSPQR